MKKSSEISIDVKERDNLFYRTAELLSAGMCSAKAYKQGLKLMQRLAAQGYAQAAFYLGELADEGSAYQEALLFYLQASNQGLPIAQHVVGVKYVTGDDVAQNVTKGIQLIQLAAEAGLVEAQYYLGVLYATGDVVPLNYTEAIKWLGLAAEQEITQAQYMLGQMYEKGNGVVQDLKEAARLYRLAAEQPFDSPLYYQR